TIHGNTTADPAPTSSPEGTAIHLTSTIVDPGTQDTFTYAWSVTKNGVAYGTNGTASDYTFTPDDNGTYVVTLQVTDDDTGTNTVQQTINVTNVSPTVDIDTANSATSTQEGGLYS